MWGRREKHGKATVVESALALVLMGILAGAVGGLAIGLVTSPRLPLLRPLRPLNDAFFRQDRQVPQFLPLVLLDSVGPFREKQTYRRWLQSAEVAAFHARCTCLVVFGTPPSMLAQR